MLWWTQIPSFLVTNMEYVGAQQVIPDPVEAPRRGQGWECDSQALRGVLKSDSSGPWRGGRSQERKWTPREEVFTLNHASVSYVVGQREVNCEPIRFFFLIPLCPEKAIFFFLSPNLFDTLVIWAASLQNLRADFVSYLYCSTLGHRCSPEWGADGRRWNNSYRAGAKVLHVVGKGVVGK